MMSKKNSKTQENSTKTWFEIALVFFVVIGIVMTYKGEAWNDEASRYFQIRQSYPTILTTDTHPPFYFMLMKAVGEPSMGGMRIFSVAMIVLSGTAILIIARKYDSRILYLSTAIFFLHPQMTNHMIEATPYSLAIFLMLCNYYTFQNFKKNKAWHLVTAILMGLTHLFSLMILIPQAIYFLRKKRYDGILSIILTILFASPFIYKAITYPMTSWLQRPSFGIVLASLMLLAGSIPSLLFLAYSFITERKNTIWPVASNILLPIIILGGLTFFVKPLWHDRYFVLFVPFVAIQTAKYIIEHRYYKVIVPTLMIAMMLTTIWVSWGKDTGIKKASDLIDANTTVLHHSTFSYYPMRYYTPWAKHYLSLKNYEPMTPIWFQNETLTPDENQHFDYEITETGQPHQNLTIQNTTIFQNSLKILKYKKN